MRVPNGNTQIGSSPVPPARLRTRLIAIGVALAGLLVMGAAPASASAYGSAIGSGSTAAAPHTGHELVLLSADKDSGHGLWGPLDPPDANGVPISHYDVTGDSGGITDVGQKILLFLIQATFSVAKWIVGLAGWLVGWVLDFKLAHLLLRPVATLCRVLQDQVIDRAHLTGFALALAGFVCGWWILTGRRSRGTSELALTVVIAAVTTAWVTSPANTVFGDNGLLDRTRSTALEVASLSVQPDGKPARTIDVSRTVQTMLVDTFVRKPHELVNYGVMFDADPRHPHKCLATYDQIVKGGPWGDDGKPRELMAGCDQKLADFNAQPTFDRLGAALLGLVAAVVVGIGAILIALGLLITQLWLVFETLRLLACLVIGLLPGAGRRQLWRALSAMAAALAGLTATILGLALFVVLVRALLTASAQQALVVRFLLVDIAAFCGLAWHRRLLEAGRRAGARVTARLGGARGGAALASFGPPRLRPVLAHSAAEAGRVLRPAARVAGELSPARLRDRGHDVASAVTGAVKNARRTAVRYAGPTSIAGRTAMWAWAHLRRKPTSDAAAGRGRLEHVGSEPWRAWPVGGATRTTRRALPHARVVGRTTSKPFDRRHSTTGPTGRTTGTTSRTGQASPPAKQASSGNVAANSPNRTPRQSRSSRSQSNAKAPEPTSKPQHRRHTGDLEPDQEAPRRRRSRTPRPRPTTPTGHARPQANTPDPHPGNTDHSTSSIPDDNSNASGSERGES